MKRILILLILFIICGCTNKDVTVKQYIDPVKDIFIFDELDPNSKAAIKKANNNLEYKNKQFEMLNKDIFDFVIEDIYGNSIDVSKYEKVIFEVLSIECEHCHRQIKNILNNQIDDDILLIQYFNKGSKQEIVDLYTKLNISIDHYVVESSKELKDYCVDYLNIGTYPTLITFLNGKLTFSTNEELANDSYKYVCDIGFVNPIYEDVKDCISLCRDKDDVKNDVSEENRNKLAQLDNDTYTEELTYSLMSSKCNFDIISNNVSEVYVNEIEDFSVYKDKKLVLLYTYLKDEYETDKVSFINELIASNNDVEYIVVLIEGLDSSSSSYAKMNTKFLAPVVSILGYKPDDFFKFGLTAYPTAVFVNKSVFTGAYSNVLDTKKFNDAIELFLGDDCIAYKQSN